MITSFNNLRLQRTNFFSIMHEVEVNLNCTRHGLGLFKLRGQGVGLAKGQICQIINIVLFFNGVIIIAAPTGEGVAFLGGDNGSVQQKFLHALFHH